MSCAGCGDCGEMTGGLPLCWNCYRKLPAPTQAAYDNGSASLRLVLDCLKIRRVSCRAFGGGRKR